MTQHWTKYECTSCGAELPVDESGKKIRHGNVCRKCHAEETDKRKRQKRTACVERLGDKCADCGESYPHVVYDFHHKADKEHSVANMIRNNLKLETIFKEVDKCELLCANCHRLRHFS